MNGLHTPFLQKRMPVLQIAGVVFGILIAVLIGASGLLYSSSYAPLLVGTLVILALVFVVFLQKPVLCLYIAIFLVFLPYGLLPPEIHSILNRVLTVATAALWGVSFLVRRWKFRWNTSMWLMLGFVLWSAVTLFWAKNLDSGLSDVQTYSLRFLLFLFLIPNLIKTRQDFDGLMTTLAIFGWIFVLAGIVTAITQGYSPGMRLRVFSANENEIGYLSLVSLVGVLWHASKPSQRYKTLKVATAFLFILMSLAVVAMSGSRGGAISWLITLTCFLLFKSTRKWGMIAVLVVLIGLMVAPPLFQTTIERFLDNSEDTLFGGREVLWMAGWELIQNQLWQGVGIGNAQHEVVPYIWNSSYGAAPVFLDDTGVPYIFGASIHNPLLTIWADTGVPGILFYLGALLAAIGSFITQYFRKKRLNLTYLMPYFPIVIAAFAGYMSSWIKGGGLEKGFSYFLMMGLLILPSCIDTITSSNKDPQDSQHETQ